jgi:hypothetical protein
MQTWSVWAGAKILIFSLDKTDESWFNITIMKQINRKNTGNWWWPVEYNSGG